MKCIVSTDLQYVKVVCSFFLLMYGLILNKLDSTAVELKIVSSFLGHYVMYLDSHSIKQ